MKHKLNQAYSFAGTLVLSLAFSLGLPTSVVAQGTSTWQGDCVAQGDVATIQGLRCLIGNVFSIFISVLGLIIFVMIIVGGFRYLVSAGNAKGVEAGRKTITSAIIGLVIALSAFIVLNLIAQFTGIDLITNFKIPGPDTPLPSP